MVLYFKNIFLVYRLNLGSWFVVYTNCYGRMLYETAKSIHQSLCLIFAGDGYQRRSGFVYV